MGLKLDFEAKGYIIHDRRSVPGDDMVRKHPVIFQSVDMVVINKIDLKEVMEVDPEVLMGDLAKIAPGTPVLLTDARHGEGVDGLLSALGLDLHDK